MNSSKIWQVFERLELKDLREIKKRVHSPAFNQRGHVGDLFNYLNSCVRDLKMIPDYESAHRVLFPNLKMDDARLRNSMNLLLQVIESYLADKHAQRRVNQPLHLAKAYRKLQLPKHYNQAITKAQKQQQATETRAAEFYLQNYLLEYEQYQFLSVQRRLTDINLQSISDNLDIAYLALKLRQTCFSLSHQAVHKTDYDFGLLPHLMKIIQSEPYAEVPAISLYYHCYLSLSDPTDESHFRRFKELLVRHSQLFPLREIRDLFLLAANYCIRRLNDGAPDFAREALDIYREGLDKKYLLTNNRLSRFTYSNIITMSLVTQEFDWAIEFAESNKKRLAEKHQQATYSFNLARLEYARGNLKKALPLLQKTEYRELVLNLTAKALTAKIYFESDEYEVLGAHLDAMQQFIRRKKMIGYHHDMFRNFVLILKKRLEIADFDKEKLRALKAEALTLNALAEKRWLLKQLSL